MKKWVACMMIGIASSTAWATSSHDAAKPRHGGVVQNVNEVDYELVARGDDAVLYLFDHGKSKSAGGLSGKLTVAGREAIELVFAGANKLEAKGVKLKSGDKVTISVSGPSERSTTIQFSVK